VVVAGKLVDPSLQEILAFCAEDPIERVFLEDVARRGLGRFVALAQTGRLSALCHVGVNAVPSGRGCGRFARDVARTSPRMLIGESEAVGELWEEVRSRLPRPREDRPGQPVYLLREAPSTAGTMLRPATLADLELLVPACAAAHEAELGVDPLRRDPDGFRWRTRSQIEEGRSWLWTENGTVLFKAEASAWTPSAIQLQQVWVDPVARRRGYGTSGLRDLCRLLLAQVPAVCLFSRAENEAAIRLYERVGMQHVLDYRSVLL
jgi:RimJ/RimL family protein N-acetyltransferase